MLDSSRVILTGSDPHWKVIRDPSGNEYKAYVSTMKVQRADTTICIVCESSAVVELRDLDEVKAQLNRQNREKPVLQFGDWPDPPPEMAILPNFDGSVASRMPDKPR